MGVRMDSDRVVKVSELRGDTAKWLAEAEEGPVFILRYGSPKAVLIGTKAFEELLDRVALRAELTRREKESVEKISLDEL
jgi:PHD/YefM family antitoxin component YafN of YafNO toxin-antitoxin module